MESLFMSILSLLILSPLILPDSVSGSISQNHLSFNAIYNFGDSSSDTGNSRCGGLNHYCEHYPYGETFFHHPTGRCSNGLLIIDFIAQFFQLPFLSAYLCKNGDFTRGVNFAVVAAHTLNASTSAAHNIFLPTNDTFDLLVQLGWFKSHLHTMCTTPSECKDKLANDLFVVGFGGNDYKQVFSEGKTMKDRHGLVHDVVQTIMNAVKELIDLGAKHIIVPGNIPMGCLTAILAQHKTNDLTKYDEFKCLKNWNGFTTFHNDQLQHAIKRLQKERSDAILVYGDYFSAFRSILEVAPLLGFDKDEVLKACCGIGDNEYNYDPNHECGINGVSVCMDPNRRVNWDGFHFTQHVYQLMVEWLLEHITPTITQVARRRGMYKLQAGE